MGTKSIRHIVEANVASFLAAETGLAGVNIYTGDAVDLNVLPKAIVLCDSARTPADLPEGAGNYSCSVRVTLFSNADDTSLATHRSRCAALAGAMQDLAGLKAVFVTSTDATLYDVTPISEDEGVDERSFATLFAFDLLAVLPA
jgi:hypothetical protein